MTLFKSKQPNQEYKLIDVYLFLDTSNLKIYASTSNYVNDYVPFVISPEPKSMSERYAYRMYPSHNLYRIITNGGTELNNEQKAILNKACKKFIGNSKYDKIENENIATITKSELRELLNNLEYTLSRKQCDLIYHSKETTTSTEI